MKHRCIQDMSDRELIQLKIKLQRKERLRELAKDWGSQRKKRYNKEFITWIETKCQGSGDVQPVDDQFYESFISLTNKEIVVLVMHILYDIANVFNEKLFSGAWKDDDEMYEFLMLFLELIAEGKMAFDLETGKMLFLKPLGDPPTDEMWNKIQKRIASSRPAIRAGIVRSVHASRRDLPRLEPTT
jgi:hypothetical protein